MPTNKKNIIIQLGRRNEKKLQSITIGSMYFTNNQLGGGSYTLIMQSYSSNNDMKKVGMPSS